MSIRSDTDLIKLRQIGRIVRAVLDRMAAAVRPGITTGELDSLAASALAHHGAEASPAKVYGFPGTACISVNEEAIHGIPGDRTLQEGDLVKLDLTAEKDGYVADAAVTVPVGQVTPEAAALAECAERSFRHALGAAKAGARVNEIGRAVEREVQRSGFSVLRELCGHGVGRTIHEEPTVPNYYDPRYNQRLTDGLVITIEPIISAGNGACHIKRDRWTICTTDRTLAAHYEHTLVITRNAPILLTAA